MAVQDAINHIQDFFSILFPRPRGFLTQQHKTICFSGSSSMSRTHFDWPQKLSQRPTLFFFLLIKKYNTTYFAINVGEITSLRLRCFYCSGSSPNVFFQKKLCVSIFVADFL